MANLGDALVIEAKKHLGKPYITAPAGVGRGPNQFDCSGLVNYCIMEVDSSKNFYWSVDYQYSAMPGPNIARASVRPGDILFFIDTPGTTALTHNGIFVSGSTFIHAKNEGSGVVYDDLDAAWWSTRLKYIKRVWPYSDVVVPASDPKVAESWQATDLVNVTGNHWLMSGAPATGLTATTIQLEAGMQLGITGVSAKDSNGYVWWPVKTRSGFYQAGWAKQSLLAHAFDLAFDTYRVRDLFDMVVGQTLRESTDSGATFTVGTTVLRVGDRVLALGPRKGTISSPMVPISVVKNGDRGWVAGLNIKLMSRDKGSAIAENGYPNKVIGEPLNLRSAPSLSGTIIGTMPIGTLLKENDGPTVADGFNWYKVDAQGFGPGYCVDGFVTTTPGNYE